MLDELKVVVNGCIIDDDHFVVRIILVEDGLEVVVVPKVHRVVERWHDDAEGLLGQGEVMCLAEPLVLLAQQSAHLPLDVHVLMHEFDVIHGKEVTSLYFIVFLQGLLGRGESLHVFYLGEVVLLDGQVAD